jgi:hypothetical protein
LQQQQQLWAVGAEILVICAEKGEEGCQQSNVALVLNKFLMGGTFRVHGKDNTFILSRVLVTTRRDMD